MNDIKYFCTHFDKNYMPQARSLYDSLCRVMPNFKLIMMCMDEESFQFLNKINYPNALIFSYKELEAYLPNLLTAKMNRSKVEYFYTCCSAACLFSIDKLENLTDITYLDADLFFFSSPETIFEEMEQGNASVGIIEHKFNFLTKRNLKYGIYNVGWITFKNDAEGLKCLKDWSDDCIEWCYQRLEGDKYADQKYLNKWPEKYENVYIIKNIGANLAIWNIKNYKLSIQKNKVFVDNVPLVFYHFASLKQISENVFKTDLSRVFIKVKGIVLNNIYLPYISVFLKNQICEKQIVVNKDTHIKGLRKRLIILTRIVRDRIFNDTIIFK